MLLEIDNKLTVKDYNSLKKSVGLEEKDNEIVQNAINNSLIIKRAIIDNKVVGMGRVVSDEMYYFIVDVVINPVFQNNGIGKKIIESITDEITEKVPKGKSCTINLIAVNGKEGFYEKCGFKKIPYDDTGYGMMKKINK